MRSKVKLVGRSRVGRNSPKRQSRPANAATLQRQPRYALLRARDINSVYFSGGVYASRSAAYVWTAHNILRKPLAASRGTRVTTRRRPRIDIWWAGYRDKRNWFVVNYCGNSICYQPLKDCRVTHSRSGRTVLQHTGLQRQSNCQVGFTVVELIWSEINRTPVLNTLSNYWKERKKRICKSYKKLSYRRVTARCVLSDVILPITTHRCRNYLYDKSWPNRWYEVGGLVGGNVS